jgi:muramidase (phage lysozyme)
MQPQMDTDAINLAKAIRQTESGGNFNAKGKSGESGAYQWTPDTWKSHAKQVLGDENAPMTPSNQNAVAYSVIKADKDAGLNPAQIAAKWNSGSHVGWENKVGVNKMGVKYDVPAYVKSVTEAYQQIKRGGNVGMDANNPSSTGATPTGAYQTQPAVTPTATSQVTPEQPQETGMFQGAKQFFPGLMGDLSGRLKDAYSSGVSGLTAAGQGNVGGAIAGGINTLGAVAGGVGDIFNRTLETVPGVVQAENAIAGTKTAQGLGEDLQTFAQEHPDANKLIGSGLNIASALPIIGSVKNAAGAVSRIVDKTAVKSITKDAIGDLKYAAGNSKTAQNLGKRGVFESLVKNGTLPEVSVNQMGIPVFNSEKALAKVQSKLDDIIKQQDTILAKQPAKYNSQQLGNYTKFNGETTITSPVHDAIDALKKHFDSTYDTTGSAWVKQMEQKVASDGITVGEINSIARELNKASESFKKNGDLSSQTVKKRLENIRNQIKEEVANRDLTGGSRKLDAEYAKLKNTQKALVELNGKKAPLKKKGGLVRKTLANALGVAGEGAGKVVGAPITGALGGRGLAGLVEPKAVSSVQKLNDLRQKSTLGRKALKQAVRGQVQTKAEESTRQ